jgi:raffinose/stachyose/melibiose transport system substrate-binding protein
MLLNLFDHGASGDDNMRSTRKYAAAATATAAALLLAACASGGSGTGANSGSGGKGPVTLTWWNNATANPLKGVYLQAIKSFEASHKGITITDVPIQNELFPTKVPLALQSDNPPDIFQQWGGGQEATQIKSGKLENLSKLASSWVGELGPAAAGWQVNGQQYGVPYDLHMVGFWYRKDLFAKAGITGPPATMTELNADVVKLKAAHIVPIAVGSKDRWPDAFYWDYFAVRECSVAQLKAAVTAVSANYPCMMKAGDDLKAFMATKPFQTGFLGTPAQVGAGSSAGLVANGKAAMELQGDWDPGVMSALATSKSFMADIGWFPFPAVSGAAGNPSVLLGGGDGFSCTTSAAEPACEQFLAYLDSATVQKSLVSTANVGLPANPAAAPALTLTPEKQILQLSQSAPYIQNYFDIAYPTNVGQALDNAVANFFAGQGSPQTIITAIDQAASQQ